MALAARTTTDKPPTIHGAPCSVGAYYRDQAGNDAELVELNAHLYERDYDAGQLFAIFAEENIGIRRTAINKHRGRACRCFTIDRDVCCYDCRFDFAHCRCGAKK